MSASEQIQRIEEYARILNHDITDDDLLDFVINEVIDRTLLYLNDTTLEERLERVVARVVAGVFAQSAASTSGEVEHEISSISDNGQTISYSDRVKTYLISADDTELFGGFSKLLAPYRRVNVASE